MKKPAPAACEIEELSPQQQRLLLEMLSDIGLRIVAEARGPVPLLTFAKRLRERLQATSGQRIPLHVFADALKRIIRDMHHDRLVILSPTDCVGVGYVYNARDPGTWPIRSNF